MVKTRESKNGSYVKGVRQTQPGGIRNRILLTAMDLFERQSVTRTYVADIMRAENLTRELFYYYFTDKESLVDSVVKAYRERIFAAVSAAAGNDDEPVDERLCSVAEAAIELFFDENCEFSPMARVLDELDLLRDTVSETARHAAACVLGTDADPEMLRKTSVLLLAGIGLAEVSDPDREEVLGQTSRLITHVIAAA